MRFIFPSNTENPKHDKICLSKETSCLSVSGDSDLSLNTIQNYPCQHFITIYVHMTESAVCVAGLAESFAAAAAAATADSCIFTLEGSGWPPLFIVPQGQTFSTRVSRECSRREERQRSWVNAKSSSSCKKNIIKTQPFQIRFLI